MTPLIKFEQNLHKIVQNWHKFFVYPHVKLTQNSQPPMQFDFTRCISMNEDFKILNSALFSEKRKIK